MSARGWIDVIFLLLLLYKQNALLVAAHKPLQVVKNEAISSASHLLQVDELPSMSLSI
jgi:hypothetical protein